MLGYAGGAVEGWSTHLPALQPVRVRLARTRDLPGLQDLLSSLGLSRTGLAAHLATTLLMEGRPVEGGFSAILGCVAVEPGRLALIRSLAVTPEGAARGYDDVLLAQALRLAAQRGAHDAVLLVETVAQVPAQRLESVGWPDLRARCPHSPLVRELGRLDSTALAVRMPLAGACIRDRAGIGDRGSGIGKRE